MCKSKTLWPCSLCTLFVQTKKPQLTHTKKWIITRTLKYMHTGTFIRTAIHRNKATGPHLFSMRVVFSSDRDYWHSDKAELNFMQMSRNMMWWLGQWHTFLYNCILRKILKCALHNLLLLKKEKCITCFCRLEVCMCDRNASFLWI